MEDRRRAVIDYVRKVAGNRLETLGIATLEARDLRAGDVIMLRCAGMQTAGKPESHEIVNVIRNAGQNGGLVSVTLHHRDGCASEHSPQMPARVALLAP